jgi:protein disulfide-isomerase A6
LGERFEIKGFPTLLFFPKGSKTPVTVNNAEKYEKGRDLGALMAFVKEKSGIAGREPIAPKSLVIDIGEDNFDAVVLNASSNVFLEFYAPC